MKILMILAVAMAVTLCPGCVFHGANGDTVAVLPAGHVHSDSCGHYSRGGNWYQAQNHRHGPNCGHSFVAGVWIVRS